MNDIVEINTAANGFIVTTGFPHHREVAASHRSAYVFETFESLTEWLDKNLRKPNPEKAPKE